VAYSQERQAQSGPGRGPAAETVRSRRALHPRHGIHEPTAGTPPRLPGSVRRTATIDMLRPDGLFGPLVLSGRARDLATAADGTATVLATSSCQAAIDFMGGRLLTELSTDPDRPALRAVLGERVSSGFRAAVMAADPGLAAQESLLNLLVDDFPVATLVSGYAIGAGLAGQASTNRPMLSLAEATGQPRADTRLPFKRDLCAGFADGGTIMTEVDATGRPPVVTGPQAPALTTDDPLGWHELGPLPPLAMRRSRRMDVTPGRLARIDVLFRDSHVDEDGLETIVHEYTVSAAVDTVAPPPGAAAGNPAGGVLAWCAATPRVLPWVECPAAAMSAGRLAGTPVASLRRHVRETFRGTSTCTHLNDTLRSLEDIAALLSLADSNLADSNLADSNLVNSNLEDTP
jgi:hypothetical protein